VSAPLGGKRRKGGDGKEVKGISPPNKNSGYGPAKIVLHLCIVMPLRGKKQNLMLTTGAETKLNT